MIERSFNIGVEHICGYGVQSLPGWLRWHHVATTGAKAIAVGFKLASHSGSSADLARHCRARSYIVGMPKGRFSSFPGLGRGSFDDWFSFLRPVFWVDEMCDLFPLLRFQVLHSIYASGFLSLVVLGYSAHGKQPCCLRFHQEFLKFLDCACITTLTSSGQFSFGCGRRVARIFSKASVSKPHSQGQVLA